MSSPAKQSHIYLPEEEEMYVTKRNGKREIVSFDKILNRIKRLGQFNFDRVGSKDAIKINYTSLVMKVIDQLYDGISTTQIDELSAEQCASMASIHPDYSILAGRITVSNHHRSTSDSFKEVMTQLYEYRDKQDKHSPLVTEQVVKIAQKYEEEFDTFIGYNRDYLIDYFGFKTLERAYLMKINQKTVERPQHMWLRVAIGIHGDNFTRIKETYEYMSNKYFTHATPTLFNAGTPCPQLSSCFLLAMESDSMDGIYNTLKDCAMISKWAGGIGLHIHNIRASGSKIRGTNGESSGICPMLRVFNNTAKFVNQGGKRNGSFAIYLEPWHADIEVFLQMRKNHGDEELKARDLFYALWVPDLFMERVKADGQWTLMCPDECPGLADVYGTEFNTLYAKYESEGKGRKTVKARELWFQVLDAQMETGTPYICYKDAANKKSNQKNLGTIKSSNLCSEIIEYSDENESAVCNLASIALPTFIDMTDPENPVFDFEKLHAVAKIVTYNLNKIIDVNYYPTEKTRRSNMRHRPIGIGIQGLADVFMMMNLAFAGDTAKQMNKDIFETIYHGALEQSCEMAKTEGAYETFPGSPASEGILQFDLWISEESQKNGQKNGSIFENGHPNNRYDWSGLKASIIMVGLRNSLLLAPMPTASTSQILGFNECIEPITSNIYNRRTLAGEFILANKYLMNDLIKLDLWNEKIKNNIIANHGSVQHIDIIPLEIREKYKTVWEIPMKTLIDMAADRGVYICQSQSLNLWLEDPNYSNLTSMHFYSWSKGLKTGIYYLRRRGRHQAQQFTIEPEKKDLGENSGEYSGESEEICEMCSA
uniref:ribonucleoside-diphosphate reductase n=1 Tax=viral metagenome TaxID=1070528 RepID=A0A6C0JGB5_9ZZZZ